MRPPNPGDRPSRLELGRRLVGELDAPVEPAFAAEVAACPVEPFDYVAILARSERLVDAPPVRAPAPRRWWALVPMLAAAIAAVALLVPPTGDTRLKGSVDLGFYVEKGDHPLLGDPSATYREGDRLQFNYVAGGYDRMILLSVDGDGAATVYFPAEGEEPVAVIPGGRHVLDASIILDDAPGPEVFLAFFGDWSVPECETRVRATWDEGGTDALLRLAEDRPDVVAVILEKDG